MGHLAVLDDVSPPAVPEMSPGRFGMWVFLVSEIMFFTGLIGSYIVLRLGSPSWPNPREILSIPLLTVNTIIMLTSNLTMTLAVSAIQRDDTKSAARNVLITAVLGSLFLAVKIFDYIHMVQNGFTISTNLFGSCYYFITAFHGLHVLSGVIFLIYLFVKTRRGAFSAANPIRIECAGLYWDFIDIVWMILFVFLCLI